MNDDWEAGFDEPIDPRTARSPLAKAFVWVVVAMIVLGMIALMIP